ncbi:cell cycle checkpoint protein RAD1 isoform X1 [Strongylocentrotus purpuratus]|uniref:Cell cycle checkpoint protein RAD1 n=1 Tax=Strongylocentrotus purpuratus TaxID=7668 RepID=A0A7M7P872_STRPU|nr:cell cycle checkpoint protein RAD1 isoform X1 [Strongylocentrotus purpuratus]
MSLSTQQSDEDGQHVLSLRVDNARNVAMVLKAIHFKDRELATFCASENGLKVTVEDAKCVQANAFIQSNIFQEYYMQEDTATFKINLSVLLECLTIFGSNPMGGATPALKMSYGGYGSPLLLMLEESGVVTDCSIKTLEPDEMLDFNFCSANVVNKIIMKSDCLKDAFQELDMTSEVIEILLSPDKPYFRLSTFGHAGSAYSDFPKDSDMVESFQCTQTQSTRYKLCLLKPSIKALMGSSEVSKRTHDRGFLSLDSVQFIGHGHTVDINYR